MKKFNDVFVVDDDKIYHYILKKLLHKNNIEVNSYFFENGLDALEKLKESNQNQSLPDLILLDINMPIMNGWQFLTEFQKIKKALHKETIIYLVSSSNNVLDMNKAKEFPDEVKDYFLKPVSLEDLSKIFLN
ncbi:response regulator [Flavobacterium sp. '19STA2R22 D10 B1']|uniref:response regulator n=1 Tax=Flavobacterium aerium TaxID=3037261 RepID=UPI00278C3B01|nr:response regulator [Flavobacterium sp. '19STA2R22 D10 B1']